MIWQQFLLLIPSMLVHCVFLILLALFGWWAWTKIHKNYSFNWKMPVLVAISFWLYGFSNTAFSVYENNLIYQFQQKTQPAQASQAGQASQASQASQAPAPAAAQTSDPALELKNKFLKEVEDFSQHPEKITVEAKSKFLKDYSKIFPSEKERSIAFSQVALFFECERFFWEDALSSFQTKTVVKSDARKECESANGSFFQREKLLPPDIVKNNETAIGFMAEHQRIPSSDGKGIEVSEAGLRKSLDAQIRFHSAVKQLFK